MEICRQNDSLEIRELDPFLAELLRQVPESAQPKDCPAAEERLFSAPASAEEKDFCGEWKLYVAPELQRLFQSATETVREDLKQLQDAKKPFANYTLHIPLSHADAWLSALNQARLAIAASYEFTEQDMCDHFRSPFGSRRDLGLFQVNFYGFLQEFILREIDGSGGH
jgi:Domain of unknown function (DUF2017)